MLSKKANYDNEDKFFEKTFNNQIKKILNNKKGKIQNKNDNMKFEYIKIIFEFLFDKNNLNNILTDNDSDILRKMSNILNIQEVKHYITEDLFTKVYFPELKEKIKNKNRNFGKDNGDLLGFCNIQYGIIFYRVKNKINLLNKIKFDEGNKIAIQIKCKLLEYFN